jgi:hypothetical protein
MKDNKNNREEVSKKDKCKKNSRKKVIGIQTTNREIRSISKNKMFRHLNPNKV